MSACKCGQPARPGQRTCHQCHADYMAKWRAEHHITVEALTKLIDEWRYLAATGTDGWKVADTYDKCARDLEKVLHVETVEQLDIPTIPPDKTTE